MIDLHILSFVHSFEFEARDVKTKNNTNDNEFPSLSNGRHEQWFLMLQASQNVEYSREKRKYMLSLGEKLQKMRRSFSANSEKEGVIESASAVTTIFDEECNRRG